MNREGGTKGWDTEDMSLLQWREDGFVLSGERLALVFQFQGEDLTVYMNNKDNYHYLYLQKA